MTQRREAMIFDSPLRPVNVRLSEEDIETIKMFPNYSALIRALLFMVRSMSQEQIQTIIDNYKKHISEVSNA